MTESVQSKAQSDSGHSVGLAGQISLVTSGLITIEWALLLSGPTMSRVRVKVEVTPALLPNPRHWRV